MYGMMAVSGQKALARLPALLPGAKVRKAAGCVCELAMDGLSSTHAALWPGSCKCTSPPRPFSLNPVCPPSPCRCRPSCNRWSARLWQAGSSVRWRGPCERPSPASPWLWAPRLWPLWQVRVPAACLQVPFVLIFFASCAQQPRPLLHCQARCPHAGLPHTAHLLAPPCSLLKPGAADQGDCVRWGTRGAGCAGHDRRCGCRLELAACSLSNRPAAHNLG